MGQVKGFVIGGELLVLLEDSEVCVRTLFFFLPHSLAGFFLSVKTVRELRMEGK